MQRRRRAVGGARPLVRLAVGPREYDAIRESVATEGVERTMTPLTDPEFNRRKGAAVRKLLADRMRKQRMRRVPRKEPAEEVATS